MLFSKNSFATLFAVVAVSVKGSHADTDKFLGTVRLCTDDWGLRIIVFITKYLPMVLCVNTSMTISRTPPTLSDLIIPGFSVPASSVSKFLVSFFRCFTEVLMYSSSLRLRYSAIGCPSLPAGHSITLDGSQVVDPDTHGFGDKISSISCFATDLYLGWVEFCTDYDFRGDCIQYKVPANDTQCQEVGEDYNDKFYTFKSTPGLECVGFV